MNRKERPSHELLLGDIIRLEDVMSRNAVSDVCQSFFALFGLPVRVISHEGELLADVHRDRRLCRYLNTLEGGQSACANTVATVRDLEPEESAIVHTCFTGAVYRVSPLTYQGRSIGRFVIGPYVPAELRTPPATLFEVDPSVDSDTAAEHFAAMPRVGTEVAEQLARHLEAIFEVLVFSGHRAVLASTMQVESVRENFRELAEKNERLKASFDELKELDKLKSSFLATVSHELRTPLTSIIGYAEMLEGGAVGPLADGQMEFLRTIRTKADQLLGLVSSLLDLGQLEANTLRLDEEPVDPRVLLSDVGSTIVPAANRANVQLDIDIAEGTPKIAGDPVRLRQILINLAENAVKFTPEAGQVVLSAEAGTLRAGGAGQVDAALFGDEHAAVVLKVTDTGRGIAEDEVARIFDAFYQVDGSTTRQHGGAGLGLSIVKQLVDAHRGTIEVASELEKGTVFEITLPAAQEDD